MESSPSLFQTKYVEFIEDLEGAFPERAADFQAARDLEPAVRVERFRNEVQPSIPLTPTEPPSCLLPGVALDPAVWSALAAATQQAIHDHLRILSMCAMMELDPTELPEWEEQMKELRESLESGGRWEEVMKSFSTFFSGFGSGSGSGSGSADSDTKEAKDEKESGGSGGSGGSPFPKLPERFLKGQLARLAQEIVKDITPEDLGITPEQISECEKNPSQAFHMLFSSVTKQPGMLQRTIAKIGKRLQQKIASGAIRPQEIAREAEELIKEFAGNASFVEMMESMKSAFGDFGSRASSGASSRLSMVRDRLRRKLEKQAGQAAAGQGQAAAGQGQGQAAGKGQGAKKKK